MDFLFVAGGLLLLFTGGDFLVRGSVALAHRLGISTLLIALTVVAFGTSAPELIVSVEAALLGATELAIGNIVGSNIANVLLVLGLPAVIAPIGAGAGSARRDLALLFAVSVAATALCWNGTIAAWEGAVMLAALLLYLLASYRLARRDAAAAKIYAEELEEFESGPQRLRWVIFFVAGGLIALFVGSRLLIHGAVSIATAIGISESVIGLTLVAFGTSLPEIVTSMVALLRKHADVAIGNVLGSNLFNLLGVGGIAALVAPIAVPERVLMFDFPIMIGAVIVLFPFILWQLRFGRVVGTAFVSLYVLYVWSQFAGLSGSPA
jgi:cation:H+ antiporter